MGYTTEFYGAITVDPPLEQAEIDYLNKFADSRRMSYAGGPYIVDECATLEPDTTRDRYGVRHGGLGPSNTPPKGQPSLWCRWVPSEDGGSIRWDEGEKFYNAAEWMQYIIDHFIGENPIAKSQLPFLEGEHNAWGAIKAYGEEGGDIWFLFVYNNKVYNYTEKQVFKTIIENKLNLDEEKYDSWTEEDIEKLLAALKPKNFEIRPKAIAAPKVIYLTNEIKK